MQKEIDKAFYKLTHQLISKHVVTHIIEATNGSCKHCGSLKQYECPMDYCIKYDCGNTSENCLNGRNSCVTCGQVMCSDCSTEQCSACDRYVCDTNQNCGKIGSGHFDWCGCIFCTKCHKKMSKDLCCEFCGKTGGEAIMNCPNGCEPNCHDFCGDCCCDSDQMSWCPCAHFYHGSFDSPPCCEHDDWKISKMMSYCGHVVSKEENERIITISTSLKKKKINKNLYTIYKCDFI
jgi:hypothetical protein